MSHTERQDVTYYSGHEIEVNGKRYIPKRTCRMKYDPVHCDFVCSECGAFVKKKIFFIKSSLNYCPNCGAMVIREDR